MNRRTKREQRKNAVFTMPSKEEETKRSFVIMNPEGLGEANYDGAQQKQNTDN